MVRRKFADRADWRRVTGRRFSVSRHETAEFTGYLTLLCIDEVLEPLYLEEDGLRVCVADRGFSWLQHFPTDTGYTLTTMFDAQGNIVQWYIDICHCHGIDERGIPWFDDLYLDIVVTPEGRVQLLDAEELEEALASGAICREDYEFAWRAAEAVLTALDRGEFPLLQLSLRHRAELGGQVTGAERGTTMRPGSPGVR